MAAHTGDIHNNLRKLKAALRLVKYPGALADAGLITGKAELYLPMLHYCLLDYSRFVALRVNTLVVGLSSKNDLGFVEGSFQAIRQGFSYRPRLTTAQFLHPGFAEQKMILITDVIGVLSAFHNDAVRLEQVGHKSPFVTSFVIPEGQPPAAAGEVVVEHVTATAASSAPKQQSKTAVDHRIDEFLAGVGVDVTSSAALPPTPPSSAENADRTIIKGTLPPPVPVSPKTAPVATSSSGQPTLSDIMASIQSLSQSLQQTREEFIGRLTLVDTRLRIVEEQLARATSAAPAPAPAPASS